MTPSYDLSLRGCLAQGLGLVFVAVYQSTLKLLYVDELLERVKQEFVVQYKPKGFQYDAFDASFQKALHKAENSVDISKQMGQAPQRGLINRKVSRSTWLTISRLSGRLLRNGL